MRTFDFHLDFTSLCGYVFHEDHEKALCVVLPNCWSIQPKMQELTGYRLRRHKALVRLRPADLDEPPSGLPGSTIMVVPLVGHQVTIHTNRDPGRLSTEDLGLADLRRVAPYACDVDSQVIDPRLESTLYSRVAAQVFVREGCLTLPQSVDSEDLVASATGPWTFPRWLDGEEYEVESLAQKVRLTIEGIQWAELRFKSHRDASQDFVLRLCPESAQTTVTIGNFCRENPLEWRDENEESTLRDDIDFLWHYALLSSSAKAWIKERMAKLCDEYGLGVLQPPKSRVKVSDYACSDQRYFVLPVPLLVEDKAPPLISGQNCFGVRYQDAAFEDPYAAEPGGCLPKLVRRSR